MPSVNLRTKKLTYSKADLMLLSGAAGLAEMIAQHDEVGKDLAKRAFPLIDGLYQHVDRMRSGRGTATKAEQKPEK